MNSESKAETEPYILFELVGTTYGVKSSFVQQVDMVDEISAVPNAHKAVEGVVFVRGQVIPALNLRVRFGFEKIERDIRSRLVVINSGSRVVGLIVDTAREFLSVPTSSIAPTPEAITGLSGQYLDGIATIGQRLILILNLEAVLNIDYQIDAEAEVA